MDGNLRTTEQEKEGVPSLAGPERGRLPGHGAQGSAADLTESPARPR